MNKEFEYLQSICSSRKSTRTFSNEPVSQNDIQKILDIVATSPYASGQKNWEVLTLTDANEIKQIAEIVKNKAVELQSIIRDDFKEHFMHYSKSFSFFENAPVLFILTFRISPVIQGMMGDSITEELKHWERDNYTKSISCAAMLLLLAAESINLGACYMTGPIMAQKEIMQIINAKPGREIGAIIPIGHKLNNLK